MEECKIKNMYDLNHTIAKELLEKHEYPWEVLPEISDFIIELGNKLDKEIYELKGENIWIAKSANVYPSAYIKPSQYAFSSVSMFSKNFSLYTYLLFLRPSLLTFRSTAVFVLSSCLAISL